MSLLLFSKKCLEFVELFQFEMKRLNDLTNIEDDGRDRELSVTLLSLLHEYREAFKDELISSDNQLRWFSLSWRLVPNGSCTFEVASQESLVTTPYILRYIDSNTRRRFLGVYGGFIDSSLRMRVLVDSDNEFICNRWESTSGRSVNQAIDKRGVSYIECELE